MIRLQNFVNCCIVGHSSDDDADTIKLLLDSGAHCFERKPLSYDKLNNLIKERIDPTKLFTEEL